MICCTTIIRQVPDCEEEAVLICPQAGLQTGQILSYHDLNTYNIHLTLTLTLPGEPAAVSGGAQTAVLQCAQSAVQAAVQTHRLVQGLHLEHPKSIKEVKTPDSQFGFLLND